MMAEILKKRLKIKGMIQKGKTTFVMLKENIKKFGTKEKNIKLVKKVLLVILVIFTLFHVAAMIPRITGSVVTTEKYDLENTGTPGPLVDKASFSQTFVPDQDFYGVAVLLGTYDKTEYGIVNVEIKNCETNECVFEKKYFTNSFKDNQYYSFGSENKIDTDGKTTFEITITSLGSLPKNHITVWINENDYADGTFAISGETDETRDMMFELITSYASTQQFGMAFYRMILTLLLAIFIGLHLVLDVQKMYEWIFNKRVLIAFVLLFLGVVNKFNFSSISQFNLYVQPDLGSQYSEPIFGEARRIRSDEWNASLPRTLSAEYSDYGEMNDIPRATEVTNMSASGLYRSYSALAKPQDWGYYLFGSEYGVSFIWCFQMIFGFLFSFELCYIISGKKKLVALMGADLIWFSSFNMWWSMANWLFAGQAALVMFYYFVHTENRVKRIFFGAFTAIFATDFAVSFYPAWQVPAGFVYAAILLWMFVEGWKIIKKYKWYDWLLALGCIAFMVSLALAYLNDYSEYMIAITNTVYPGTRVSYGGFSIYKLFGYIPALFTPFFNQANPSELGCFVSFFPIPFILGIVLFVKEKGKDLLTGMLLVISAVLSVYCIVEMPTFLAKIFLLTYSTPARVADIVGYIQILLLVIIVSKHEKVKELNWKMIAALMTIVMGITLYSVHVYYPDYMRMIYFVIVAVVLGCIGVVIFSNCKIQYKQAGMIALTVIVLYTGLSVNPLVKGLDAIKSKPVAKKIAEIVEEDPDAKWIALDTNVNSNFLIACGAPTINSVNYVPNMEFWKKLDPSGEQEEVYNRYAHLTISLTKEDTSMWLTQGDAIQLNLSYSDIKKLDIKYIWSIKELKSNSDVKFKTLYVEDGVILYEVE